MNYLISKDNLKDAENLLNKVIIEKENVRNKALEQGDEVSLFLVFTYAGIFDGMEKLIDVFNIKATFNDNQYIITSDGDAVLTYEMEKLLRTYIEQDKKAQEKNLNDLKKSSNNNEKFDTEMKIYSSLTTYLGMSLFADKLGLIIDESQDINNMLSISNGQKNLILEHLKETVTTFNTILTSKFNNLTRTQELVEKIQSLTNKKKSITSKLGSYIDHEYISVATNQIDSKIEKLRNEQNEIVKSLFLSEEKTADIFEKLLRCDYQ